MIQPISKINYNCFNFQTVKNKSEVKPELISSNYQLSGFKTGQAILNRNNISFKNLAVPIEVTNRYNKPIQGKDHLDLPNIHIYEYPDTNLQVFVDANKLNTDDKNKISVCLNIIDAQDEKESLVKYELAGSMICKSIFEKDFIGSRINYNNFFGVNYISDQKNFQRIKEINHIVTSPEFDQETFETAKKELINNLIESKPGNQNLLQETINEIQNTSLKDIEEYYHNTLRNSEARLIVSVDEGFFNQNKKELLKIFNESINGKFKPKNEENLNIGNTKLNTKQMIYRDKYDSNAFMEMHYFMPMNDLKSIKIAEYINLLAALYKHPYIDPEYAFPLTIKLSSNLEDYLNGVPTLPYMRFSIIPQDHEKMKTERDAIDVYKKMLWTIQYEPLLDKVLENIKKDDKKDIKESMQNDSMTYRTSIIQDCYYDVFKMYEIIDDITIKDIINAINKHISNQEPIIYINENSKPYKRKEQ